VRSLQYFEMAGSRALYADGWKAVTDHVPNQFGERGFVEGSHDFDTDRWSLFHLAEDFSEATDLADERPDLVRRLEELWWSEAGRNQVLPLFEFPASMAHMHPGEHPRPTSGQYAPDTRPVIESRLPALMGGFELTAEVAVGDGASGIITAIGDQHGGWAVYLLDGRLVATVALLDRSVRVASASPVPSGSHHLSVRYIAGRDPQLVLSVDGEEVARDALPGMLFWPNLSTSGVGMLVGRDRGLAVSDDYEPPFAFEGTIERVVIATMAPGAGPDRATELQAAFAAD